MENEPGINPETSESRPLLEEMTKERVHEIFTNREYSAVERMDNILNEFEKLLDDALEEVKMLRAHLGHIEFVPSEAEYESGEIPDKLENIMIRIKKIKEDKSLSRD